MLPAKKTGAEPPAAPRVGADRPSDYTADSAPNRSLYLNLGVVKLGTTDPLQGAAILLSLLLLSVAVLVLLLGFILALCGKAGWMDTGLSWLGAPLSVVIGVAIGRGGDSLVIDKNETDNGA